MALRLIDVGIPTFEWKTKRVELFFSEEENTANQLQTECGKAKEKDTLKKRFELRDDHKSNLDRYRMLIRKIPTSPGIMVISGMISRKQKTISVIKSDNDLREAFKNSLKKYDGQEIDRFNWLKKLTTEDGYSFICFQIAVEN